MLTVDESLNYLKQRPGYSVGDAVLIEGQMHVQVKGTPLTYGQISDIAVIESFKDEAARPDGDELNYMAVLCRTIGNHRAISSLGANEGRELAQRWEEYDPDRVPVAQLKVLSKRMAHYITENLAYLEWNEIVAA